MLTCDVHKPPTQAIRSIFVEDYTADELSVRALCFLYRSAEQTTGYSARTRSSQSVSQSFCQSVTDTARHHTHRNRLLTFFDVLQTVHLSLFILVINQLDA